VQQSVLALQRMEAVCLVLDTGLTSSRPAGPAGSFLERAVHCASSFVERKLYSESKDLMGLVLFGTEETANPLDYPGVMSCVISTECHVVPVEHEMRRTAVQRLMIWRRTASCSMHWKDL
jgi:hypothetical protein